MYALHCDFEQIGVGSIGVMDIYFPFFGPVETPEFACEILRSGMIVIVGTLIVWEVITDWLFFEFSFEQIHLVQEQNYRGSFEPGKAHN